MLPIAVLRGSHNERDGITHDFTRKEGVEHCEIVLPDGVSADWARDRSKLWNAAEFAENRKDARVAREFELALPHELSPERRIEAARMFALDLANRYGVAVDFAIHAPHIEGDIRNVHAHCDDDDAIRWKREVSVRRPFSSTRTRGSCRMDCNDGHADPELKTILGEHCQ